MFHNNGKPFPGGSRERVTRAGNNVRVGNPTEDDYAAINDWRAAHRQVINSFQAILRGRTRETNIIVAQRHKRKHTIFDKLRRLPKMQLGRMDDVAGCRLTFPNIAELYEFRNTFHKSRFNHKLKNDKDKYDYIAHPKSTGYRGIHDVYAYDVKGISNNTRLPLGSESLKHVNQKAGGVGHGSDGLFRCREALRRSGCQE